jgi:cytoskeleton protein RodZ
VRCGLPETGSTEISVRTVGSYLKEVRESKGIGLEEAAGVTRIGKNYLLAIEGEAFDKLPSAVYVKGFLRVYAGYLGLQGDEIVAMYDKSRTPQQSQHPRDTDRDRSEPQRNVKAANSAPGRWLAPLFLLVAVVAAAYLVGDIEVKREKEPHPTTTRSQVATLPAPVQAVRSTAAQKPGPVAVTDSREKTAVAADKGMQTGIILRLKVNQDCWLNITIDNTVSQQYDLKAGDLIEWKGDKVFTLDIGNAGGIEGEFNGRPLGLFGEPGKTAHVTLKAP